MSKQLSDSPLKPDEQIAVSTTTGSLPAIPKRQPAVFWPWLGALLLVGLFIVGIVTFTAWNWLNNVRNTINAFQPTSNVTTVNVQRSVPYADLNVTLTDLQSAPSFNDDPIHAGHAVVRASLSVHNPTSNSIAIAYYDVVRLLVAKQPPVTPANLNLSSALAAGATTSGWVDFPAASNTDLSKLTLQLGNAAIHETLVVIPASGAFNASQYTLHTYHPSLTVNYYFQGWQIPAYYLYYHLTSVDVRYSYNGVQASAGQQFYVLNFSVDNPNGVSVAPGWGNDYVRLDNRTPVDATLPSIFKANAQHVTGHVTFAAPAGMHALNIVFLRQAVPGGDNHPVSW
jgi:hypothetical protein